MHGRSSLDGRTSAQREPDIVQRVADGATNAQIGRALGLPETTIKNELRKIYDRLGLWNRVELALWYIKHQYDHERALVQ